MATIFSGMQPTGGLHLGNYLGALRQWVKLGESGEHQAIYCVVDAHALTVDYEPQEFSARVREAALTYLAGGVDPERAIIFVQSQVKEHFELAWYLSCVAPMGELGRMTQFKEKSEQHKQSINAGLFTYPVLMAADILLYKATLVPVGADQVQHLEFARDTARHFNKRYRTEVFPEPLPHPMTLRIMGLDGSEKMSKSRGNTIGLLDPPKTVRKKIMGAFTDPARVTRDIPGTPEICNIYTMHTAISAPDKVAYVAENCRTAGIGCGDCKNLLLESLEAELVPLRQRAEALVREPARVDAVLREGAAQARAIAARTMREVRSVIGVHGDDGRSSDADAGQRSASAGASPAPQREGAS
jgi:tryptophanyl-tRNA synthetase